MEPASKPPAKRRSNEAQSPAEEPRTAIVPAVTKVPTHPWDGYLAGPENELALAAIQAMVRGERDGISPLVIHGPSGVGKSRLLAGLVAEWLQRQPGSSVAHLDAQMFVTACFEAAAVAGGMGWSSLRGRFRSVDLFVLEDLEGLERGPLAYDELVHTIDALGMAGAAMAFSAHTAPGTWRSLDWPRRLVNRLTGGLAVRIAEPGLTSRRRYILQHAAEQGVALEAEAVERLTLAADGYRTLEGWISRLAWEARQGNSSERKAGARDQPHAGRRDHFSNHARTMPLDTHTVDAILAEETLLAEQSVTIDAIAHQVAERFGVRLGVLRGPTRRASIVAARHVAMHLARTFTGESFAEIGAYFGGRDPATVRHACKAAVERLKADPILAAAVASLQLSWSATEP